MTRTELSEERVMVEKLGTVRLRTALLRPDKAGRRCTCRNYVPGNVRMVSERHPKDDPRMLSRPLPKRRPPCQIFVHAKVLKHFKTHAPQSTFVKNKMATPLLPSNVWKYGNSRHGPPDTHGHAKGGKRRKRELPHGQLRNST